MNLQIVIDCQDPHGLAGFWAEALGYDVEDPSEQIEQLLEDGIANPDDVTRRHGRLVWRVGAGCRDPQGRLPRLLLQAVDEPKTVKNRVHLDLQVGEDEREQMVERLLKAGATRLWDAQQGPFSWVTLADPEGNEFCVA